MRIAREQLEQWSRQAEKQPLSAGLIADRDYAGLQHQACQIRVWLPDQARIGLEEVCARTGVSMTVYLTEFFATYLFGVHELLRMRDAGCGLYADEAIPDEPAGDLTGIFLEEDVEAELDDPVPEMGKNIFAIKIFLPRKIKSGLQHRANIAAVPLGRFVRSMICAHLFGRNVGVRALMGDRV